MGEGVILSLEVLAIVADARAAWQDDKAANPPHHPLHGSRLNWTESEFAALRYLALNSTGHRTHGEHNAAIGAYIRWRAEPKTNFAPDSPIRQ
ncbi:hypothetical protein ABZ208_23430 [Streptomyces sp. NPDC006208]|uniref:hypothetical protein n=1 Tax=Streptomyces sp. NPDC006208 TaxID=3156734 RepID=UPI0033B24F83